MKDTLKAMNMYESEKSTNSKTSTKTKLSTAAISAGNRLVVGRDSVVNVLKQRQAEAEGCFSLPLTVAFFCFYTLSILYHEDVTSVYLVESSVKSFLEDYSFDEAQSRTLHGCAEPKDVWKFFQTAMLPMLFRQSDNLGNPLDKSEWSTVLGQNHLHGGVLIEQFRRADAGAPGNYDLLGAELNGTDLLYFPGEGSVAVPEVPMISQERRLRAGGGGGQGAAGADGRPEGASGMPENTYPFFLFEQEPLEKLSKRLAYLERINWIDADTSMVAVKFILRSERVRVLMRVNILFMFPKTGGLFTKVKLQSSFLDTYVHWIGYIIDCCWVLSLLYVLVVEFMEVKAAFRHHEAMSYFKDFWNCLDWATVVIGLFVVMLFADERMNIDKLDGSLEAAMDRSDVSEDYWGKMYAVHQQADALASLAMWSRIVLADYVLLVMLRFFKAFKGQPRLAVVTNTIYMAGSDLFHFGIVFFSVFMTFAFAGTVLFGRRLPGFNSFGRSVGTCFAIICGDFQWATLSKEHALTAGIWFWSFMSLVFLVMLNMVLAIVMDVYTRIRADADAGDAIWVKAAEIAGKFHTMLAARVHKDEIEETIDSEVLVEALENLGQKITVARLQNAVPGLSYQQAVDVLQDALGYEQRQDSRGMSLSDAVKLIQKMHKKVEYLVVNTESEAKEKQNKGGVNAVVKRNMVRLHMRNALLIAFHNGQLHKIADELDQPDVKLAVEQAYIARKIERAEAVHRKLKLQAMGIKSPPAEDTANTASKDVESGNKSSAEDTAVGRKELLSVPTRILGELEGLNARTMSLEYTLTRVVGVLEDLQMAVMAPRPSADPFAMGNSSSSSDGFQRSNRPPSHVDALKPSHNGESQFPEEIQSQAAGLQQGAKPNSDQPEQPQQRRSNSKDPARFHTAHHPHRGPNLNGVMPSDARSAQRSNTVGRVPGPGETTGQSMPPLPGQTDNRNNEIFYKDAFSKWLTRLTQQQQQITVSPDLLSPPRGLEGPPLNSTQEPPGVFVPPEPVGAFVPPQAPNGVFVPQQAPPQSHRSYMQPQYAQPIRAINSPSSETPRRQPPLSGEWIQ